MTNAKQRTRAARWGIAGCLAGLLALAGSARALTLECTWDTSLFVVDYDPDTRRAVHIGNDRVPITVPARLEDDQLAYQIFDGTMSIRVDLQSMQLQTALMSADFYPAGRCAQVIGW